MSPAPNSILSRDILVSTSKSNIPQAVLIAGVVFAVLLLLGTITWLGTRWYRRKARARGQVGFSGFLSVHGVAKDIEKGKVHETFTFTGQASANKVPTGAFSRSNLTSSIVFPVKATSRTPRAPRLSQHRNSLRLSREITASPRQRSSTHSSSPLRRESRTLSSLTPSITPSRSSSASQNASSIAPGRVRTHSPSCVSHTVRQGFISVLNDELPVRTGDQLIVLQSYDDEWCAVGRLPKRGSILVQALRPKTSEMSNVELGVVPASVFTKPTKGVYTPRPLRSSSLAAAADLSLPTSPREAVISWSNFA